MLKLTKKQAIKIVAENNGVVAEEVHGISKEKFLGTYIESIGKVFYLGEVNGVLKNVQWFDGEVCNGLLTYYLPYRLDLIRKEI